MAPILASSYFPPLDKCLSGEELLVSWKSVFLAVTSTADLGDDQTTLIESFLANDEVLDLLENPYAAYPPSSIETKNAFDTKTSAINVTPSSNAQYDIKEIKEDALWLSNTAKINEISALRIVVEECQSRDYAQLLGPFSEEELASIRDAAGNNRYSSSIPIGLMSQGAEPQQTQKDFGLQENRRKRILRTYLSERTHLLKCSERLFHQLFLAYGLAEENRGNGTGFTIAPSWLQVFGTAKFIRKLNADKFPRPDEILKRCIGGITANMKNLMAGSGWFSEDGGREDVEIDWTQSQITEAIHSMELMWQFLQNYSHEPCSSETILDWFKLQQDYSFFNSFDSEDQSGQRLFTALQSISAILSLSMLGLDAAVEYLSNPTISEVVLSKPGIEIYTRNTQTMVDITNILIQAADNRLRTSSPSILAWTIILQTMTDRMLAQEALDYHSDDRASSVDTLAPDPYKEALEQINDILQEDINDYLARSAIDSCQVFDFLASLAAQLGNTTSAFSSNFVGADMRGSILGLIRYCERVGYNAEIVGATIMALTSGQDYWDLRGSDHIFDNVDPVAKFWSDQTLKGFILQNAVCRYPFESMPFLQLLRALAYRSSTPRKEEPTGDDTDAEAVPEIDANVYDPKTIAEILDVMPFFTYALPPNFVDYETTQEEENRNNIRLTKGIHLFVPRSYTLRSVSSESSSLVMQNADFYIPAGTIGRIVSESDPKVAYWYHQYSGFAYLGKLLETFLAASDLLDATTGQPADRDSVSEIIEIFAVLISPPKSGSPSFEAATEMFEKASSGLSHERDIIGIIFDIFQEELQNQSVSSGAEVPLDILVSCVHFIHALIPLYPARVWPLLTYSGLLDLGRGSGRLPVIVEGVELLSGRYDLLVSCCHLFDSLVDDFATNAIRRRSNNLPSKARLTSNLHRSPRDISTGIPENTASNIIFSFTRYFVVVLESSRTWKYNLQDDRQRIGKIIGTSFCKILNHSFGIEEPIELERIDHEDEASYSNALAPFSPMAEQNGEIQNDRRIKIMEGLMLGASHIVESFLSTSSGALRFQPLLRSYFDGLETPETTVFLNLLNLWTGHVGSMLSLSQTLLRIKTMLGLVPSPLETQIFKSSSLIARLYAAHDTYKNQVVGLFEALIVTASSDEASEPPSLLGHLGPHTARNFLRCLSGLDKPLSRQANLTTIWHFLSMVMGSRQQWFANYLLTGKTPRDAMKVKSAAKDLVALDTSFLATALDTLSHINDLPQPASLAMLEFVALAQNYWPWTVCNSPQYQRFIGAMQEFVGRLKPLGQSKDQLQGLIEDCYQTRIAAYVAEILAMHLFHSRQTGSSVQLKSLIPNLSYFKRFATAVPDYKQSLHSHLKKNFEAKYPGSTIEDLKRTPLDIRQLGTGYFYDTSLADQMLSLDQGWHGVKGNGLREDVHRANVNLSLVDAQIALFHSWKFLSIEISSNIGTDPEVQTLLSAIVTNCLVANGQSQPPEEIFSTLSQTRAEFALVLGQRLVQAKSSIPDMQGLLPTVWKTIENLRGSFDKPLLNDNVLYYRSLLKLLFLSVRVHAESPVQSDNQEAPTRAVQSAAIPTILSILEHVVAKGLRELATSIHDSPADSSPEDLALITGILQSCLRIPGIELNHGQIVAMMINCSAPLLAIKLFSWAETITIDGDPIYGELSILFLLELSSMPPMAEQLAVSGILSQICSAGITSYFRRPGVSPFAESAGLQRCYSIWARGILPLLLNLLDAVQSSVAIEVAQFLNQFPLMLAHSEQAFDAPETDRIIPKGQTRYITATICSEVHSMSLLVHILTGFREALVSTMDIPDVKWDAGGVLENVMFWLQPGSGSLLRGRILPMGEREAEEVQKAKSSGKTVSTLEIKIVAELKGIRDVLGSIDSS